MNRRIAALLTIIAVAVASQLAGAEPDKEKTITGEAACAKCLLKEGDDCALSITTEEGAKKVTYHVVQNDVTKKFGHQVCKEKKKVTATGSVKLVDGKQELTPTKIELVKG